MASQLDYVMTFDQAEAQFQDCILPSIQESEQRLAVGAHLRGSEFRAHMSQKTRKLGKPTSPGCT